MDKALIKVILRSVGITLLISTVCGIGTRLLFKSFFGGFLIAGAFQYIGGYIWSVLLERRDRKFAETLINSATETPVPIELSCAYCNTVNHVPLLLSQDNVFKCVSCNQPNNVYIQFTTVRVTQPLTKNEAIGEVPMLPEEPTQRQTTVNEPIKITGDNREPGRPIQT